MAIRDQVKQFLRTLGHALASSVHERLTAVELRLDEVGAKLNHIAVQGNQSDSRAAQILGLLHDLTIQINTVGSQNQDLARQTQEIIARQNEEFATQLQDLAYSDAALLQGSIHLVESFKLTKEAYLNQADVLARLEALGRGLNDELAKLLAQADSLAASQAFSQSCLTRIDSTSVFDAIAELRNHFAEVLQNSVVQQVCVETTDYDFANPEVGLICYLYSYLPSRRVIDVGAHVGDVSEALVKAGYEVYAFEPFPVVYQKLIERIGERNGFHPFPFAIGSTEGEMPLHLAADRSGSNEYGDSTLFSSLTQHSMPGDLPFTESIPVPVRTLANLHRSGILPDDIGLLKIDTEGFDLEVIRGMGDHHYPVVAAEFWDTEIPFGKSGLLYTFESLVTEMKGCGYPWHIVLYRVWGRSQTGYYCDHSRSVPKSWGNVFFFRDYDLFAQAQKWCSAVLPQTYFKSVPAPVPVTNTTAGR